MPCAPPTLQAAAYGSTLGDTPHKALAPLESSACDLCQATIANLAAACPACAWTVCSDCSKQLRHNTAAAAAAAATVAQAGAAGGGNPAAAHEAAGAAQEVAGSSGMDPATGNVPPADAAAANTLLAPGATSADGVIWWSRCITCPNPLCSALQRPAVAGQVLDTPAGALVCQPGGAVLELTCLQAWEVLEELRAAAEVRGTWVWWIVCMHVVGVRAGGPGGGVDGAVLLAAKGQLPWGQCTWQNILQVLCWLAV
jgi:hypothetical protein